MSSGQKVAFSLLSALILFCFFLVFANPGVIGIKKSGLLNQIETRFYRQAKIVEKQAQLDKLSDSCNSYITKILEEIETGENAYLKDESVKTFLFRTPDPDLETAKKIHERRINRTEQLQENLRDLGLDYIRLIDNNKSNNSNSAESRRDIHYSTNDSDTIGGRKGLYTTFKNYEDVVNDEGELSSDLIIVVTNGDRPLSSGNVTTGDRPLFSDNLTTGDRPQAQFLLDKRKNRFIVSFPFYRTDTICDATLVCYFKFDYLINYLMENDGLLLGQNFDPITGDFEENTKNWPKYSGGFVVGIPHDMLGHEKAISEFYEPVLNAWNNQSSSRLERILEGDGFTWLLMSNDSNPYFKISAVYKSNIFELPAEIKLSIYLSVFITILLIAFLILSIRRDYVTKIRSRIKKVQLEIIKEYLDKHDKIEWNAIALQIAARKDDLIEEIKKSLGIKEGKKKEKYAELTNSLLESSWDEILTVIGGKADKNSESLSGATIDEIRRVLEEVLHSTELNVNVAKYPLNYVSPDSNQAITDEVEEIDEIGEIDEVDEIDEIEEVEDIDAVEEIDEVDEINESDAIDDSDEINEIDAIEDIDEIEGVEEVDEIDEIDEPLVEKETVERIDRNEEIEINSEIEKPVVPQNEENLKSDNQKEIDDNDEIISEDLIDGFEKLKDEVLDTQGDTKYQDTSEIDSNLDDIAERVEDKIETSEVSESIECNNTEGDIPLFSQLPDEEKEGTDLKITDSIQEEDEEISELIEEPPLEPEIIYVPEIIAFDTISVIPGYETFSSAEENNFASVDSVFAEDLCIGDEFFQIASESSLSDNFVFKAFVPSYFKKNADLLKQEGTDLTISEENLATEQEGTDLSIPNKISENSSSVSSAESEIIITPQISDPSSLEETLQKQSAESTDSAESVLEELREEVSAKNEPVSVQELPVVDEVEELPEVLIDPIQEKNLKLQNSVGASKSLFTMTTTKIFGLSQEIAELEDVSDELDNISFNFDPSSESKSGNSSEKIDSTDSGMELEEVVENLDEIDEIEEIDEVETEVDTIDESDEISDVISIENEDLEAPKNNLDIYMPEKLQNDTLTSETIIEDDGIFSISKNLSYSSVELDQSFKDLVDSVLR